LASKETQLEVTEETHIINWWAVSNLCSLGITGICLEEWPHIQTELLEAAEQP